MKLSSLIISIYSILFSIFCAFGFFGYGIDFYLGYSVASIGWGTLLDSIGFFLSSLVYKQFWIGSFLSSILQFIVYSRLLFLRFGYKNFNYKLLTLILISFSWSHLLSSLNMVRQSLAFNIFYLIILSYKNGFNIGYFLVGPFLHKISPILWLTAQIRNRKLFNKLPIKIFIILSIFSFIYSYYRILDNQAASTVGYDLTPVIFIITIAYSFLVYLKRNLLPHFLTFITTISSTLIFSFIISGANQISERVFLSYLNFMIISLLWIFKDNFSFKFSFLIILISYIIISWTIGPLQNALY